MNDRGRGPKSKGEETEAIEDVEASLFERIRDILQLKVTFESNMQNGGCCDRDFKVSVL